MSEVGRFRALRFHGIFKVFRGFEVTPGLGLAFPTLYPHGQEVSRFRALVV